MSRSDAEWDELTAALNAYGVRHVLPGRHPRRGAALPAGVELFRRLAQSEDVRLQESIVVLLLTHPDLAGEARGAIEALTGAQRDRAARRYVAAAALQRMWRTRIELALGSQPLVEAAYLDELGLPDIDEEFGQAALWELSAQEERLYGYNAWAGYTSLMDMFLGQMRLSGWGKKIA